MNKSKLQWVSSHLQCYRVDKDKKVIDSNLEVKPIQVAFPPYKILTSSHPHHTFGKYLCNNYHEQDTVILG